MVVGVDVSPLAILALASRPKQPQPSSRRTNLTSCIVVTIFPISIVIIIVILIVYYIVFKLYAIKIIINVNFLGEPLALNFVVSMDDSSKMEPRQKGGTETVMKIQVI